MAEGLSRVDQPDRADGTDAGAAESATAARNPLSGAHGAGDSGSGRNARNGVRVLPGYGLAAGSDHAASRPRRALRVGVSDSARRRYQVARRARRAGAR